VRSILAAHPSSSETIVITDMEAGLEHLSRSTTRGSDVMLVVAEPYYKSLETASRVYAMAAELGIPAAYLVANKVRSSREAEAMTAFGEKHAMEMIAMIPYDESMAEASMIPQAPFDYCPEAPGVIAIQDLATRLSKRNGR
jgi:CO dehydrogenase maturation factor